MLKGLASKISVASSSLKILRGISCSAVQTFKFRNVKGRTTRYGSVTGTITDDIEE